jgi:hypothetical protein
MPLFAKGHTPHNKKAALPPPVEASQASVGLAPEQRLAEAQAAVSVLLGEQADIEAELFQHREQRTAWLAEGGDLDRVAELARQDERLRLRREQIGHRLPPLQAAVHAAWLVVQESAWQDRRPALRQAEQQLAAAIRALYAAIDVAHELHNAAHHAGFGGRLGEFVRPPAPLVADYALRQYVATVEQREREHPSLEIVIEVPADQSIEDALPRGPRFVPRQVPRRLIEQVSPLERRTVRITHAFNAAKSGLNIGHALLAAGTEMTVAAKAAFVMTYAGVAEYLDAESTTAPAA